VIRSFDIFDTVLTRVVGSPEAVFLCTGQNAFREGLITMSPKEFKHLRIKAETEARRKKGGREVTLEDIYESLAELGGISLENVQSLLKIELEIEDSGLRPVNVLAGEVADARVNHGTVAFLSDMYLPAKFLETKLRSYGLFRDGDHLLVSADQGATKYSGKLYLVFLGNVGLKPAELLHRGDNWMSDVQMPKRLGIRTAHFDASALNRYERILENYSEPTEAVTSFFAGASRLVRLDSVSSSPRTAALRSVAAGVAGPTLLSYVLWVLRRADQLKLKRIYFLARDGQILLKLARIAAPIVGFTGDLRYLHASRQALRLPTTNLTDPEALRWSLDDTTFISIISFLESLDLTVAGLEDVLLRHGLDPAAARDNLDKVSRQKLPGLIRDARFRRSIGLAAEERKRYLTKYLQQEGVVGADECGIVDLGWNGTLQVALECVIKEKKAIMPVGFYFGLSRRASEAGLGKREAFFFDEGRKTGFLQREYWVEPMLEVFCAADHGTTLRFEPSSGRVIPVLKSPRNDAVLAWGLVAQQKAILQFAGFALDNCPSGLNPESLRPAIHELLGSFWNSPSTAEAEAWGTYPYADDQTEACWQELGEPFGWVDCLRSVYRGKLTSPHRAGWIAGGLMRSARPVKWALPPAVKTVSWFRSVCRFKSNQ
jgi:FMN phosphatase YigB (HAD superfamily)